MKEYIVSTQDEYDRTIKNIDSLQKGPFYDIERGKGTEIVGEIDSLVHHYVYHVRDKKEVYDGLSFLHFDQSQADEIIRYFQEHLPGDMFDIECGLNRLHIIPHDYDEDQTAGDSKVIIKDSKEKIVVRSNVEAWGNSFVEAFGNAFVIAKNDAYIIAHDAVSAEAYHKSRVDAYDHSQVRAFNNALVTASGESRVQAYHGSIVRATEKVEVSAYHGAYIRSMDEVSVAAYDKSIVDTCGNSTVNAFNKSHIIALGMSLVTAHDQSLIHASDKSKIEARNQSFVLSRKNAFVTGIDSSLILSRDNAQSITGGNCSSISENDNNAENLRNNILTVMRHPRFSKDPILAVKALIQALPEKNRESINKKLLSLGCYDEARTKVILSRWVKNHEEDISYER
jgi:hypothetical protein